ncbi:MAG: hypothetical protein JKY34_04055 [Kordiimonadaceae bacterium]|nr:hypothetical protein [Kordiimonadaceae bacterium]
MELPPTTRPRNTLSFRQRVGVWYTHWPLLLIVLLAALSQGFSFADSNQGTYLPPGIRLVDPEYLLNDRWLNSVFHYHLAFSVLVAAIHSVGFLAEGLAIANTLSVLVAFWAMYEFGKHAQIRRLIPAFLVLLILITVKGGLQTAATTFLFSSSMQASSLPTMGLILACAFFVQNRLMAVGYCLAITGLFHTNFLLLGMAFFGLTYTLLHGKQLLEWRKCFPSFFKDQCQIILPSLLVFILLLPGIMPLLSEEITPENAELAAWLFRDFAVPEHYKPSSYLIDFYALAGWQTLGLIWTRFACVSSSKRSQLYAIQGAFIILIWLATLLTTVVYIDVVSRLFFWRLAPFSLMISILIFTAGTLHALYSDTELTAPRLINLFLSGVALLFVARTNVFYYELFSPRGSAEVFIIASLLACVVYRWVFQPRLSWLPNISPKVSSNPILLIILLGAVIVSYDPIRFKLLTGDEEYALQKEAYTWIESNTATDAIFLIPPELRAFRLEAGRAIVVNIKALPFGANNLIEWYRRLEKISATSAPTNYGQATAGYKSITSARIEELQLEFNVSYALLHRQSLQTDMWSKVRFCNKFYVILDLLNTNSNTASNCPTASPEITPS